MIALQVSQRTGGDPGANPVLPGQPCTQQVASRRCKKTRRNKRCRSSCHGGGHQARAGKPNCTFQTKKY
jgi:hypothetical protein